MDQGAVADLSVTPSDSAFNFFARCRLWVGAPYAETAVLNRRYNLRIAGLE